MSSAYKIQPTKSLTDINTITRVAKLVYEIINMYRKQNRGQHSTLADTTIHSKNRLEHYSTTLSIYVCDVYITLMRLITAFLAL